MAAVWATRTEAAKAAESGVDTTCPPPANAKLPVIAVPGETPISPPWIVDCGPAKVMAARACTA
eukprot:CAMPEP_0180133720 /NCGR_PEP_ID=MMETSP0986-20121125/9704_1 /TAXON_ID=697907 /ORGANISM="non described non described, Strain CCMP2293" /LENGTH=63 /DNA_ID=CAMNT_0022073883 /DNA_START=554 /DNA_END=745 /DNA_ORIENTATION=+